MMYGVIGIIVGFIAGYCFRILREAQAGEVVHVHPDDIEAIAQPMMEDVEDDEPPVTYVPMQPIFTKKKKIALFVLMVIIFYFLLYRPQKKQQKQRNTMMDNLKVGHRILTIGGIHGEITYIDLEKSDFIRIRIADNVEIKISSAAVARDLTQEKTNANPANK